MASITSRAWSKAKSAIPKPSITQQAWNKASSAKIGSSTFKAPPVDTKSLWGKSRKKKSWDLAKGFDEKPDIAYQPFNEEEEIYQEKGLQKPIINKPKIKPDQTYVNDQGETVTIKDGKTSIEVPKYRKGFTSKGMPSKFHIADSMDEILNTPGLDERQTLRWIANFQKSQGEDVDPNKVFWTDKEEFDRKLFEQERDKSRLEMQFDNARKEAQDKVDRQRGAITAQLGAGREGVTSASNVAAIGTLSEAAGAPLQALKQQREELMQQYEAAKTELQTNYTIDTANRAMMLQAEVMQAEQGLIEAQTAEADRIAKEQATAYERQKYANEQEYKQQQDAISNMMDFADAGMVFDFKTMQNMALQTGLPFEVIAQFNDQAKQIQEDKKIDDVERQLKIEKLKYDLQQESITLANKKADNVNKLAALYKKGVSADQIAWTREIMGLGIEDDPAYQLQQQETKLIEQAATLEGINTPSGRIAQEQTNLALQHVEFQKQQLYGNATERAWHKGRMAVAGMEVQALEDKMIRLAEAGLNSDPDTGQSLDDIRFQVTLAQRALDTLNNLSLIM
jgi:hypothetical protein